MIAVFDMRMIMHPAIAVVENMRSNDKYNCRDQQPALVFDIKFLNHQERKACYQESKGKPAMMMFTVSVVKRITADCKGNQDHPRFESFIIDDINAKQRQAA